jgi:Ca-activated chloride channel family protein
VVPGPPANQHIDIMSDFQIGNPTQLQWLWLVGLCIVACVFAAAARRRARTQFATANLISRMLPPSRTVRRALGTTLVTAAMALLVVALVDVRWGKVWRDVPQKGIEVMFVLDVSRSMLADDAAPNRLERAKQQIKDTVDEMAGDRVGLIVFAGDVKQQIPLTTHYDHFKQSLDAVGPHNVRRGGSRLGDAIEAASHAFLTKSNAHKAMVIFTDGEDQESEPIAAARKAHEETGVRIFTVGLGDMDKGSRIPLESENHAGYLEHDGELVWSKLDGKTLRQIATETDGAYVPAGTKQVNMADVYNSYIAGVEQTEFETARINQYEARYQWFLVPALVLLLIEIVVTTWPARGASAESRVAAAAHQKARTRRTHKTSTPQHSTAA